jgi:DNA-binding SARP family transcriptional activator
MDARVRLALLGGFEIDVNGKAKIRLPLGAQRLLAILALGDGVHRATAAERLWPDSPPRRAAANLRSALWQGRRIGDLPVIECTGPRLRLAATVAVDLRDALSQARRISISEATDLSDDLADHDELLPALSRGLLPDWSDEWLLLERERWDQVRLHTLETLAQQLISAEKYLAALEAAFAAVAIEPIRESAHRTVVEVYIAEGNSACALKYYQRYRGLLHRELGVAPSRHMTQMVHALASV